MLNIIAAILLFGMIVLVHEFGHFLFAKLGGIGVVEFSVGMGPRLFSFVRGGTCYSIKALPFGGSCAMVGEDSDNSDPKAFNNKPVWTRIAVIAAGPGFNFLLAFLFSMVLVFQVGHDAPVLIGVFDGSPAQEAGLQAGDRLVRINRRRVEATRDISLYLYTHPGETVTLSFDRAENTGEAGGTGTTRRYLTQITPVYDETYQSYMLGIQLRGYEKAENPLQFLSYSVYEVKYCIVSTFDSFGMLFRRQIRAEDAVAGPVQIVSMVGESVGAGRSVGLWAVVYVISSWMLLLSASLGIMNLLPLPALDGGRLLFLLIELVRGRPIDPEKEGMVHMAGMMLLMTLMVLILFNDIHQLL